IPARVAGVPEIALCVPPDPNGRVPAVTLAAAALAGVDEVYRVGGAQAIAALAYGTETIRPADVIVGPGNMYVTAAKREVAAVVGDYVAGVNHVLPTARTARFASALRVDTFRKHVHVVTLDQAALARVAPYVQAFADMEGLDAHGRSVQLRGTQR